MDALEQQIINHAIAEDLTIDEAAKLLEEAEEALQLAQEKQYDDILTDTH